MSQQFVVSLTRVKDDADRATVDFVVANATFAGEKKGGVFLNIEDKRPSQSAYADDDRPKAGFASLMEIITRFDDAGRKIHVRLLCVMKRALDEGKLIPGAKTIGGAAPAEFMGEVSPSLID